MVTGHAQLQKGSSSEAIIGLLHQAEAFMITYAIDPFAGQNGSRHWQVVRKGRTDNGPTPDWYLVDSLDQAAHTAQVKIMTEADWKNIHGTLYIIKQCTESRMLDSCEFTDEELLAHQQRLEGEEARAARVPMRNHNTLPHLNTRQGPAQRAGLIQTTINKVDEHAPMNPREPRQPSKPQNIQAPKTANPNAHSCSTPDIGNYFHKLAQPTTHIQEVMHQPLHGTTYYSVPTTDDGTRPTPPAPKIGCMNKDPNDPLQALPESSPIKQQLLPPPKHKGPDKAPKAASTTTEALNMHNICHYLIRPAPKDAHDQIPLQSHQSQDCIQAVTGGPPPDPPPSLSMPHHAQELRPHHQDDALIPPSSYTEQTKPVPSIVEPSAPHDSRQHASQSAQRPAPEQLYPPQQPGLAQKSHPLDSAHATPTLNDEDKPPTYLQVTKSPATSPGIQGPVPAHAVKFTIMTLNIRGLGTGTADILELLHKHKPEVLIITETKATKTSRKSISKGLGGQGYYQYYSSKNNSEDEPQAGVLILLHKKFPDLGMVVPITTPDSLQGYIKAVQIRVPSSTPLDVVGVYMPTGQPQDKQTRDEIYKTLATLSGEANSTDDPHYILIGGDFNATLANTDRRSNCCIHTDRQHRHMITESKLHPLEPPTASQARQFTWRQGAGEEPASRIDDFFTNDKQLTTGAQCTVIDMGGSTTDHDVLQVDIPYQALNMIPPPDRPPAIPDTKKLKLPLTLDEANTLRDIIEMQHGEDIQKLCERLEQILQQDVHPHWASISAKSPRQPAPIPSIEGLQSQQEIQALIDALGDQIIDLLTGVRDTALNSGPTVQHNSAGHHMYPRGTAKARKRIKANTKQVATAIRHQDATLIVEPMLKEKWETLQEASPLQAPEEGLKQLKRDLGKELRTIDREHAKLCQQEHLRKMQALYDDKQKIGNKIITGQYKGRNSAALHAIHTEEGLITDPQAIVEIIEQYYTKKMVSATGIKTGKYMPSEAPRQYPWAQEGATDRFQLETAITTGAAPHNWLHSHIQDAQAYQACVKTLSHGKAPGPDGVTNEMLQLLPPVGQRMLHAFIQLMWASSCTPKSWKHSTTALLWKEKGTVLELKYYRRIGLELTIYKLWTRMITWAMSDHAERNNILTYTQGGFRNKRTTSDQLELMTMILEDAKLTQQDIYLAMIDYTEAFDTIDHDRLLHILYDLGFPTDAIDVVQNLYTNATTAIKTPHGSTSSIPMERGTIQGDSLSPFLFIVYLEPLLRWLRVGVNGYIPGVYKQSMAVDRLKAHIPDSTYADDLNLVTHTAPRLQKQLDKVTNYSIWGNLIVNISKTLVTGARYHTNPKDPYDSSSLKRILSSVTVQGQPVTFHDPRKPFRYLGVHFTMHMDWSHQLQVTIEALKSMLKGIKASNAKVYQKMRTIKSCIRSKVRYTFCVAPYSDKDIHNIDSLISRACKSAHGLPLYIARAFVHEDIDKGGLGCPSMQVEYKEVALQRLVAALNDHGPLGEISRARMDQDHHCLDHMTAKLHPVLAKHSLRLRQQIACADLRLTIMRHGQPMYCLPEPAELLGQITSVQNQLQNSVPPLLRRDIQRLCKVGITSLQHLLTPTGRQLMPLKALQRKLGKKLTTTEQAAHKRVCHMLRQAPGISTQDYKCSMTQGTNTHSHTVHPDHVRTLQALEVVDTADARGAPLWSLAAIQQQPHLTRDTISELQTYIQNMRCRNKCAPTSIRRQLEDAPQQIRTNTRAATGYMTYQKLTAIQPLTTAQERQLEQLYIRYAADVDQIDAIVGVAKAAQHRKIKGQRERTAQQDQVVVRWKPTLMQGWVAEIAQNILKYRIAHARAATTEEIMDDTQNSVVECCSRLPECKRPSLHDTTAIVCDTCHRAYHIECLPPEAKSHAQNALEDNQHWHCNECTHHQWTEDSLPKEVRHLLITWEDSSEDKETLMTSSGWEDAWAVYTSRCGEEPHAPVGETQTHASQNQLAKAQQQLPSLQQQGDYYPNHSTRYNITIGQECRHKLHVHTEAINPHTDIEPTGQHEVYIRTILMRCNERNEEHELACIYTPDGRCRFTLTVERAAILYQQYKRVQEAKPKLVKRRQLCKRALCPYVPIQGWSNH